MNRLKNTGLALCGLVLGLSLSAPAAQAVESLKATLSTNRVLVDGQEVRLTAYNINGNNYVMLRDIGRAVGFNVYWDSDAKCVQVESGKPYTGEAPVTSAEAKPVEQPSQTDVATAKQDIIDRTNALRRAKGIAALSVTDSKYTGENIHSISELYLEQQKKTLSEAVVNLWSNSKAHADNMTSSRYGEIGVGLARGVNQNGLDCWYCVQVFLLDGCVVTWVDTTAMK